MQEYEEQSLIEPRVPDSKILVFDDDEDRLLLIRRELASNGHHVVHHEANPRNGCAALERIQPDVVILDMHMPPYGELELLAELLDAISSHDLVPIIGLTADPSQVLRERALLAGISDYLSEPFLMSELVLRVDNQLRHRRRHLDLLDARQLLERRVHERTQDLENLQLELLERLAVAGEYRDDDTADHTRRVSAMVREICLEMGFSDLDAETLARASLLHDIGKIGVNDRILRKPGRLTDEEIVEMRRHTRIGGRILQGSRYALLQMAETIAHYHHERWDGGGYAGLEGSAIPLGARIVAVADVFDALTSARPYKEAWPLDDAIREIAV